MGLSDERDNMTDEEHAEGISKFLYIVDCHPMCYGLYFLGEKPVLGAGLLAVTAADVCVRRYTGKGLLERAFEPLFEYARPAVHSAAGRLADILMPEMSRE